MRMHQRRPAAVRLAVSLSAFAGLASAIVIPSPLALGTSSPRRSLNFGPSTPAAYHSESSPSPALELYNSLASSLAPAFEADCNPAGVDAATCLGTAVATSFLGVLHPTASFQLVNAYVTKHLGVLHAYFVQTVDGTPVANANVNVNVDLATGTVLSYGDASFARASALVLQTKAQAADWKAKVASWAGQVVLGGGAAAADNGPQGADALEEFSSPPLVPQHDAPEHAVTDPRRSLLAFLALQSPMSDLTAFFLAANPDDLTLVPSLDGDAGFTITNVPSAVEPVKATRAYVHDGKDLALTWRFEVRTDDNHYEAYVKGDDTLMVVDWVRDFRPTGGEAGFDALAAHKLFKKVRGVNLRGAVRKPASQVGFIGRPETTTNGLIDSDDAEAVAAFKSASPAYKVFPWGVNAPDEGKRQLLKGSLIELDNEASPAGWHTIPSSYKGGADKYFTDTRGNNVVAQDNPDGGNSYEYNYRPNAGKDLLFDYKLGWPKSGTPLDPHTYINASVTELFYTSNEIHDLFYRYGFDEISGNFQDYNFGRGGLGDDGVQANAQDGSGMNNANFATPPDGSRPRMRMYSWTGSQPYRDGDFEAGIVIHEYSHGISTRLTGGPANSGCLGWGEAGGMGEGWGDFFSTMIRQHAANETEYSMGEWASSRANGIRYYPYSLNMSINPSTYKFLDGSRYWGVHAIGEVWAEILFTVAELLIDEHGFSSTLFPPAVNSTSTGFYDPKYEKLVPKHGNSLVVQLVVDAMKLQPCHPTFQDARDAIIAADKVLTKGANECILWKGFSSRGLGPDSKVVGSTPWGGGVRTDDYDTPSKCSKSKKPIRF